MSFELSPLDGATVAATGPTGDASVIYRPTTYALRYSHYATLLHPVDTRGIAVLTHSVRLPELDEEGQTQWRTKATGADGSELAEAVDRLRARGITMNLFRKRKGEDHREKPRKPTWNLAALTCTWVDLDFYKMPEFAHATARTMVPLIIDRCYDRNIPFPSYIMSSGRGALVVWLHERQKPAVLQVWRAMQRSLHRTFEDMGSDHRALPATMTFSVAGHTKTERKTGIKRLVEVVYPEYVDEIVRHGFTHLREALLDYTPKQVAAHLKAQAAKRAVKAKAKVERRATAAAAGEPIKRPPYTLVTLHRAVHRDLTRLFEARFPFGLPPKGYRDAWCFDICTAAAWFMTPEELAAEVDRMADLCGLKQREARGMMGSLLHRARRAAQGRTDAYGSARSDPRYKSNPAKLVSAHGIERSEMVRLDLRILVNAGVRRDREAQRSQNRRAVAGAKPRGDAQAARLALGQRGIAKRGQGMTLAAIAAEEAVSVSQLRKAIREASVVGAIGKTVPKPKQGRPRKADPAPAGMCHDSTGSIDACAQPVEPPAAVVPVEQGAYTAPVRCSAPQTATDARCAPTGPAGVVVSDDEPAPAPA
ncbi:MAG: hypothetical protein INR70_15525 [Parafilimonas terrae]|nr:hypothetical protein [Parafilimonas terrae]